GGNGKAARQIDKESAVGKRAAEPLGGPDPNQVAGAAASCSCETNPEESFHAASPFFRPRHRHSLAARRMASSRARRSSEVVRGFKTHARSHNTPFSDVLDTNASPPSCSRSRMAWLMASRSAYP